MQEIWKDVKGYEGLYQVSNIGNVRSVDRYVNNRKIKGKSLLPSDTGRGYLGVSLYKNGNKKTLNIHKLVANSFIPCTKNKSQVNHKDGDKHNNNVSNLEWCSCSENIKHAFRMGLKKPSKTFLGRTGDKHPNSKKIICVNTGVKYQSLAEAAKCTGTTIGLVSLVCSGKRKHTKGLVFIYEKYRNN